MQYRVIFLVDGVLPLRGCHYFHPSDVFLHLYFSDCQFVTDKGVDMADRYHTTLVLTVV